MIKSLDPPDAPSGQKGTIPGQHCLQTRRTPITARPQKSDPSQIVGTRAHGRITSSEPTWHFLPSSRSAITTGTHRSIVDPQTKPLSQTANGSPLCLSFRTLIAHGISGARTGGVPGTNRRNAPSVFRIKFKTAGCGTAPSRDPEPQRPLRLLTDAFKCHARVTRSRAAGHIHSSRSPDSVKAPSKRIPPVHARPHLAMHGVGGATLRQQRQHFEGMQNAFACCVIRATDRGVGSPTCFTVQLRYHYLLNRRTDAALRPWDAVIQVSSLNP